MSSVCDNLEASRWCWGPLPQGFGDPTEFSYRIDKIPRGMPFKRPITPMKFDLPEPFGPIKIFSASSGIREVLSPNERKLRICRLVIAGFMGCDGSLWFAHRIVR